MKAIKLTIKNIGLVADTVIQLNKPLIVLYGEIRAGKTTVLNSVKWVFGGTFPTDIIKQGEAEGSITLSLDCGAISRSFYVAKDGTTKARPVKFERNGAEVKDPVAEIKKLLNPFLLNQNHLIEKTELERKKFFAELFSVDTSGLDQEIVATELLAAATRSKLKGYGDIDLSPMPEPPDMRQLQEVRKRIIDNHKDSQIRVSAALAGVRAEYQAAQQEVRVQNAAVQENNFQVLLAVREVKALHEDIERLELQLAGIRSVFNAKQQWLKLHDPMVPVPQPTVPDTAALEERLSTPADTTEVDTQLRQAEADKVRFEQYQNNCVRQKEREKDESQIVAFDAATRELRNKRIAKLKELSESTGIPGLAFDEAGNFSFEGSNAGMLSTSQLMRLSSMLSALYPEGFGIELIDRAESLGKSIFEFVDRAKAEGKTILAAVVGERPADIPEEVGVFVVSGGHVTS
jgi:hypothetical protein